MHNFRGSALIHGRFHSKIHGQVLLRKTVSQMANQKWQRHNWGYLYHNLSGIIAFKSLPRHAAAKAMAPMLFILSDADAFFPFAVPDVVYEACASAADTAPELYWDAVTVSVGKYIFE